MQSNAASKMATFLLKSDPKRHEVEGMVAMRQESDDEVNKAKNSASSVVKKRVTRFGRR